MKKEILDQVCTDEYLGCFGDFNVEDVVCKKYCALSLRCAIEKDQNERMEILEDLMASEQIPSRLQ
jgi:hypothetical protein